MVLYASWEIDQGAHEGLPDMISGFLALFCFCSPSQTLRLFPGVRAKSWEVRELNKTYLIP